MKRRRTYCLSALLALSMVWPTASHADAPIPHEPGDERLIAQSYDSVAGFLFRDYSLRANGQVDYRTARHILSISYDDPASDEPDVALHPLFYWYNPPQDGQWELWIDREEEGHLVDVTRMTGSREKICSRVTRICSIPHDSPASHFL